MSDKKQPEEKQANQDEQEVAEGQLKSRRDFLRGLGRWSAILIGAAVGGNLVDTSEMSGWVNGGRSWVNARGGGGSAGWVNRTGGGGGSWVNRSGGAWINGGRAWINGGGSWINRRGY